MRPRWFRRLRAHLGGYFWMPCPVCGEYFGGHETHAGGRLLTGPSTSKCTCPRCPGTYALGIDGVAYPLAVLTRSGHGREVMMKGRKSS